jgi:uncharacterized protein YgiM (DUF1202 family)
MKQSLRTIILTVAAFTAFASPVLAEATNCVVTAPEIRLRKSPNKGGKVVSLLKKDTKVTVADKCKGGWVKVTSEDGRVSGYVGGWALADVAINIATPAIVPEGAQAAKTEPALPVTVANEVPTNEQLAVQITKLRLDVLRLDRDMAGIKKEIQKVKGTLAHKGPAKHVAANSAKPHKLVAKRD